MAGEFSLIEAELRHDPPRRARASREGLRKILLSLGPIVAAIGVVVWLFYLREQPRWVEILFLVFAVTGGAVLLRLVGLWLNRIELVERGVPEQAVVVYKRTEANGETLYYAWYSVGRRQWGIGWRGGEQDAEIGDAVTVLHGGERRPGHAVVYRWAGYCALNPRI